MAWLHRRDASDRFSLLALRQRYFSSFYFTRELSFLVIFLSSIFLGFSFPSFYASSFSLHHFISTFLLSFIFSILGDSLTFEEGWTYLISSKKTVEAGFMWPRYFSRLHACLYVVHYFIEIDSFHCSYRFPLPPFFGFCFYFLFIVKGFSSIYYIINIIIIII